MQGNVTSCWPHLLLGVKEGHQLHHTVPCAHFSFADHTQSQNKPDPSKIVKVIFLLAAEPTVDLILRIVTQIYLSYFMYLCFYYRVDNFGKQC